MKEPICVQFVNRAYMFAEPLQDRTLLLTGPLKIGHIYLLSPSKIGRIYFSSIERCIPRQSKGCGVTTLSGGIAPRPPFSFPVDILASEL